MPFLPLLVVGALAYGLYRWFDLTAPTGLPGIATSFPVGTVAPAGTFIDLAGGGAALSADARALYLATNADQVISFDANGGVAVIGPPTLAVTATGGDSANAMLRSAAPSFDLWISTVSNDRAREVVASMPGQKPLMGKTEVPLANSAANAADLGHPTLVRFSLKGESF